MTEGEIFDMAESRYQSLQGEDRMLFLLWFSVCMVLAPFQKCDPFNSPPSLDVFLRAIQAVVDRPTDQLVGGLH